MADFIFPIQFRRQFAGPLDIDMVFQTTSARNEYLTNPRRYAGQIVSDLEAQSIYTLRPSLSEWVGVAGETTFTNDLTVSLNTGKTFGRYVDGNIIPAIGKTASQIINMALVEPITPIVTLNSSSTVQFNQTNVNNSINFSHTIKSLGATAATAILEFKRGSGSWSTLSSSTSSSGTYVHSIVDTPYNTQPFYYRYTVTDSIGATNTANLTITPVAYSAPTIPSPTITAASTITSPETNTTREKSNVNSNISATITRNSPFVDLVSYIIQYRVDSGSWIDIGTSTPISGSSATVTLNNHIPTGASTANTVSYRIQVNDGYQTTTGNQTNVNFYYLIFYGPSSTAPTTSSDVRNLPNRIFTNGSNPFILKTGNTFTKFTVAMPNALSITQVLDLDASSANLTGSYNNNPFSVNDYSGNAISYKVYTCSIATPYTANHDHQITR